MPKEEKQETANLCLDAGYVGKEAVVKENGFIAHIRPRGEEKKLIERDPSFKARRWVVELAHSWFNRFRKLLVRYEKWVESYEALIHLAAAIICWKAGRLALRALSASSTYSLIISQPRCRAYFLSALS